MTEEQYAELAQLWHEYMIPGPRKDEIGASLTTIALNFSEWINTDEDEPCYGLPEIHAFFHEKERREGTAIPEELERLAKDE
jgi:hypothetical protein